MPVELTELRAAGYRSLRDVHLPLGRVTVVVGANGSGKTNLYRVLRLLAAAAAGRLAREIVAEGGMPSVLWAGPRFSTKPVRMRLGVTFADGFSYELAAGLKSYGADRTVPFPLDPDLKGEALWHGRRRPTTTVVEGKNGHVRSRDDRGTPTDFGLALDRSEAALHQLRDPLRFPELSAVREAVLGWRFYHEFPTHAAAPARHPRVGTFTPVLAEDGADLASAVRTIFALRRDDLFDRILQAAFPGSEFDLAEPAPHRIAVEMRVPGVGRPLAAHELSDGTLRFLFLAAALLGPRPAPLVVLNEPETSLHPDLIAPLADLIAAAAAESQVWVTTHSVPLAERIADRTGTDPLRIERADGATVLR